MVEDTMKNILLRPRILGILFSLYFCGFLVYANIQKPRIMVLHSYDKEYAWTRDVSEGIHRILDKYPQYSIKWHYMDTKRRTTLRYKKTAAASAISLINRWDPHVVIAIDDNAQSLVASKFVNKIYPQIIFSGVNGTRKEYGYDTASNVTGILERLELNAVKSMISKMSEKKQIRIALVTDHSPTSTRVHKEVESFNWEPLQLVSMKDAKTLDDWKAAIKNANKTAEILLITNYHTVETSAQDNKKVPPGELIKWTMANTTLPNIGGWGFFVEDGGMVSTGVSPFEQGEEAAKMAVQVIEDEIQASSIPYKTTRQFITYARKSQLDKAGFQLPKVYEAFARATNNYYMEEASE